MIEIAEARKRMLAALQPVTETEDLPVAAAWRRTVAKDLHNPQDIPPFPNSAMDGYAFRHPPASELRLAGTSKAGHPYPGTLGPGEAARIFTGAMVPAGADTIAPQEIVRISDAQEVSLTEDVAKGSWLRPPGMDLPAGELLVRRRQRLSLGRIGLLAAAGLREVCCFRPLRLALFATGDELRTPGEPLDPGCIFEANLSMLGALCADPCWEVMASTILPDHKDQIREKFLAAASEADAIIISGGMSVGDADFAIQTLLEEGEPHFWKLALKPGKPFAFGRLGNSAFFGLPGNPVSTVVGFTELVAPALDLMAGGSPRKPLRFQAKLASAVEKAPGRMEYQRGWLECDDNQEPAVRVTGDQSSNRLHSIAAANCYIVLPLEQGDLPAGTMVLVQPFGDWLSD